MRLFETIYMKVTDKDRAYYLLYKSYVCKHDGRIDYKEINQDRFKKAKDAGLRVQETDLENARFGAKRRIKRGEFKGEIINV